MNNNQQKKESENCFKIDFHEEFPILKSITYLDNSSTTQKPQVVLEAMNEYYTKYCANVHRGLYPQAEQATQVFEEAHQTVAQFIGAEADEIIFTSGTTESINLLAQLLGKTLQPGDEIVLSIMEHHSNLVPWQQIAKEKKAQLKYINLTKDYHLDLNEAKKIISKKTKIVSITHMSNVLGTINPVKELTAMAHKVGALIIIDAAQSTPHLKLNVKELSCDFLAFSGHKLCGPTGIGVLYGKKRLLQDLEPSKLGGGMIKEVTLQNSTWAGLPAKFEAGTPNIAGALGLAAAIKYLQKIGLKNIEKQELSLTKYALDKLKTISGLKIIGPPNNKGRGAVISFTIKNAHPHDVAEILARENIAIRAGHHCAMPLHTSLNIEGTSRMSFYFYNTTKNIDAAIKALHKVNRIFQ
ncbi:cysteine desulfurase [Candidatus Woesearchaeota archaeon]|nr:cysteine desulfurase [Candidatus Woesearchaeota archaeon]